VGRGVRVVGAAGPGEGGVQDLQAGEAGGGVAKQGAGRGYTGVKGLNVLLGIISTSSSRQVIAAARLRKGSTNSAKGAHRFVADTLITARSCGATGTLVLRADSAFYQSDVIAAVLRRKACFSITARQLPPVRKGIDSIAEDAWTPIKYTNAIWDEDSHQWISDAEVAEIAFTAFTSKAKAKQVTARLIVRRVPDVNPAHQSSLFTFHQRRAESSPARPTDRIEGSNFAPGLRRVRPGGRTTQIQHPWAQNSVYPPSMTTIAPVMKLEASEAR